MLYLSHVYIVIVLMYVYRCLSFAGKQLRSRGPQHFLCNILYSSVLCWLAEAVETHEHFILASKRRMSIWYSLARARYVDPEGDT